MEEVCKQCKNGEKNSSSGIYKTRYYNDSYLLLLGKRKLQSFDNFSYLEIIPSLF